jgi:hypothetical protein
VKENQISTAWSNSPGARGDLGHAIRIQFAKRLGALGAAEVLRVPLMA